MSPILFIDGIEVIECPACKGRGYLVVWDDARPVRDENDEWNTPVGIGELCTHCMGDGTVPAKS